MPQPFSEQAAEFNDLAAKTTASGIEYYIRVDPGSYSERFARDGNQITAQLICRWEDAADFRDEVIGYTEYIVGTQAAPGPVTLKRQLPMLCPYSSQMYAVDMQLLEYGRFSGDRFYTEGEVNEEEEPEGDTAFGGSDAIDGFNTYYLNEDKWPEWGHCVYQVTFMHLPWTDTVEDDDLDLLDEETQKQYPIELQRYIKKEAPVNIRELRRPDYGFETDEASPVPIPVVGFVPAIEKDVFYTWYQVPYFCIPRAKYDSTSILLHVNDDVFDGYAAGTLLYVGTKDIEKPYRGADGRKYYDPTIHFRWNPYGWNKILLPRRAAPGNIVSIRAKNVTPVKRPYEETDQFYTLFQPKRF